MDTKNWADELAANEAEVLEAGLSVGAPSGAKKAVWTSLAAKLPAAAATGVTVTTSLSAWALLKPLAVGLALGGATATGIAGYRGLTEDAVSFAPRATQRASPAATATAAEAAHARGAPHADEQLVPLARPSRSTATPLPVAQAPVAQAAASHPPAPSVRSFSAEATLPPSAENALIAESQGVTAARSALHASQPRAALEQLDALDRRFASGMLVQEREALRIEALSALGQREAARALARRFLERYPESPHASAVAHALR